MAWESEIYRALVEIVKAGGFYAILGIFTWGILPTVKVISIMLISWLAVRSILKHGCNLYLIRKFHKGQHISLLSKTVSKDLEVAIKKWRKEHEDSTKELLNHLSALRESEKSQSKKSENSQGDSK